MEQDILFLSKSWLPVIVYYLAGFTALIVCYALFLLVERHTNTQWRFLFIIVTTLFCAAHIITGFYDVVGYHGYGYSLLRAHHVADYETIRFGIMIFVTLKGLLLLRI